MDRFLVLGSIVGFALLGACSTTTSDAKNSAAVPERLAAFEKTGETTNCLNLRRISSIKALDERHFLVEVGVNDYYLNKVSGRCSGADRTFNRLQYKTSIASLCRNEIIRVVDNSQGFTVGSCGLGNFERLEKKTESAEQAAS